MTEYKERGSEIRGLAKTLVLHYMKATQVCQPRKPGMTLAEIFRECGFDWGDQIKATSSNQQYWVSAIMRELEAEGITERVSESGPWRLL
ncbi:MAG: hypothetical protein COW18_02425 [Zetaproteobacteria bacterium CG12_big_fil_rev_8_21_14_0_65_54_13]|nr:MAG: hypothetical protein COW18_02425 [Zetaproteobacteria bacterium CG12_big_fil_rev_8_21_14_0_65_54_13]